MSIQARVALIFSLLLEAALVAFTLILYAVQSDSTLAVYRQSLLTMGKRLLDVRRVQLTRNVPSIENLASADTFVQLLDVDGSLREKSANLEARQLPYSAQAAEAVAQRTAHLDIVDYPTERLLIYTAPVLFDGQVVEILQAARSLAVRDQGLQDLRRTLINLSFAISLPAFFLIWWGAGMALRPIQRVSAEAQRIGNQRNFGQRIALRNFALRKVDDEIGELVKTINGMLDELQNSHGQTEQALQLQQRFVAEVSHELRTPLTTLRGNLDLLQRQPPVSAAEQGDIVQDMLAETERLMRLVGNLLTLARLEARREMKVEALSLAHVLDEVCRQARLIDPQRLLIADEWPLVSALANSDALKQLLLILLDNAYKHTRGKIILRARTHENSVQIVVEDDWPGLTPQQAAHIFERFRPHSQGPGLGMGLSIAQALAQAMGAALGVESAPGQGSKFILELRRPDAPVTSDNTATC